MTEPYRYGFITGSHQRHLLYVRLADALYSAVCDVAEPQITPLGIRQGTRILYRHSQLVALHARFAAQLAAGEHWPVIQALEAEAAARLTS